MLCPQRLLLSVAMFLGLRQSIAFQVRALHRRPLAVRWMTEPMENLYQEWSLEQDQQLWSNRDKTPAELASLLGRGLRGVEARLAKLSNVDSPAYARLFSSELDEDGDSNDDPCAS